MERLTEATLKVAAVVEEMIREAVCSLCDARTDLAQRVLATESAVDRFEVEIEERCFRILALHDPVAGDLRRVTAALKVNLELERMADLTAGIARRAMALASSGPAVSMPEGMEEMAVLAAEMVRGSLDAFVDGDADRARVVIADDDAVDRRCREVIDELRLMMRSSEVGVDAGLALFSAAANLERIADHATNIAEEVVYQKEGLIIRHGHSAPGSPTGRGQAPRRSAAEARLSLA